MLLSDGASIGLRRSVESRWRKLIKPSIERLVRYANSHRKRHLYVSPVFHVYQKNK